jgi:hypothetical protein
VDFGNDAVGGSLVRDVGGDCGDAEPGADGPERIGADFAPRLETKGPLQKLTYDID